MKENCFVGIDTSNYTSSAAVCTQDGKIIANIKIPLPVKEGERGIRQSDAVFEHVRNIPSLMLELNKHIQEMNVLAIGVSSKPRDAEGSYMPCFLSGVAAANSFAAAKGKNFPIYEFSHQNGHIMAALYSGGCENLVGEKFVAFHVSGGTTEALLVRPRKGGFGTEIVGKSADINAGQAIDRVGVHMGMSFPCGPALEKAAIDGIEKGLSAPAPHISVKDGVCNLSGLENMAKKMYADTRDRSIVSLFVLDFIAKTLAKITEDVDMKLSEKLPVLYAGGVMSNSIIKKHLSERENTFFASPDFSSDNAAGTALLCRRRYMTEAEGQE